MSLMDKKTMEEFMDKQVKPPNTWQYHCLMFQEGLVADNDSLLLAAVRLQMGCTLAGKVAQRRNQHAHTEFQSTIPSLVQHDCKMIPNLSQRDPNMISK